MRNKTSNMSVGQIIPTDFGEAEILVDYGKNVFWRYKCITRGDKPKLVFAHPRVRAKGEVVAWDDPESQSEFPDHKGKCQPCGEPNTY
jgi:hypothetical protein